VSPVMERYYSNVALAIVRTDHPCKKSVATAQGRNEIAGSSRIEDRTVDRRESWRFSFETISEKSLGKLTVEFLAGASAPGVTQGSTMTAQQQQPAKLPLRIMSREKNLRARRFQTADGRLWPMRFRVTNSIPTPSSRSATELGSGTVDGVMLPPCMP